MSEAELINLVSGIFTWDETSLIWFAVTADVHGWAPNSVSPTTSPVNAACFISDVVLVHILVGFQGRTSKTALVFLFTRNDNLGGEINIWPSSFASDLNPIWECRCRRMSPAWTTVLRNVLVTHVCQIVPLIDVTPVPVFWQVLFGDHRDVSILLAVPSFFQQWFFVASLLCCDFSNSVGSK